MSLFRRQLLATICMFLSCTMICQGQTLAHSPASNISLEQPVPAEHLWRPSKATLATLNRILERSQQKHLLNTSQGYWLLKQGANGFYTLSYQVFYYYPDEAVPGCKVFFAKGKLMVVQERCTPAQNNLEWRQQLSALINAQLAQQYGVEVKGSDGRTYTKMSNSSVFRGDAYLLANKGGGLQLVDVIEMQ